METTAHETTKTQDNIPLLDSMGEGVFRLHENLTISSLNAKAAQYLGMAKDQALEEDFVTALSEDGAPKLKGALEQARRAHKNAVLETETTKGTKKAWYEARIYPLKGGPSVILKDITAQKRAEEALRRSEERYRLIVENVPQWIFTKDTHSMYTGCNKSFAKTLGREKKDIIGKDDHELYDDETARRYRHDDQEVLRRGVAMEAEETFTLEGKTRQAHTTKVPLRDDEGKIIGLLGIFQDVTERNEAQRRLHESEEKFAKAFAHNPSAMQVIDFTNGKRVMVNDNFCKMLGYTEEEILSQGYEELQTWVDPKRQKEAVAYLRKHRQIHHLPVEFSTREGESRHLLASAALLDIKGRDLGVVSYLDITEQKEAEEKLRNVVEHSTNLFYSHTPEHVLTYVSPQVKDYLGYGPEEAKKKWTEFITDNPVNERGFKLTEKAIKTGKRQAPYELELRTRNGRIIWVEVHEAPLTRDGKTVAIVGSLTDITERKRAEEELIASRNELSGIIDGVEQLIITADKNGVITGWNKAAERKTGLRRQQLIGARIGDLSFPESIRPVLQQLNTSLQTGKAELLEIEASDAHENPLILVAGTTPLKDLEGKPMGVVLVANDITGRRHTHHYLQEGKAYLSERLFSELAGVFNQFKGNKDLLLITRGGRREATQGIIPQAKTMYLEEGGGAESVEPGKLLEAIKRETRRPSAILLARPDYLAMTKGFRGLLQDLYAISDWCRERGHILLLHVVADCFSEQERTLLKQELHRFQMPGDEEVRLSEQHMGMLRFIANKNQLHAKVNFNTIGREFKLSRATTKQRVERLQQSGLVSISKEGKEKRVDITDRGLKLL